MRAQIRQDRPSTADEAEYVGLVSSRTSYHLNLAVVMDESLTAKIPEHRLHHYGNEHEKQRETAEKNERVHLSLPVFVKHRSAFPARRYSFPIREISFCM